MDKYLHIEDNGESWFNSIVALAISMIQILIKKFVWGPAAD
jgi:hypothetical protein